jgi:hypothetical protein
MSQQTGRVAVRKNENSGSTLPEVGKIKVGEKTADRGLPKSLDYFRATGPFASQFNAICGDKPKKLQISFISDDLTEVCNEQYQSWVKGKRWGWGDGLTFTVWDPEANNKKGAYITITSTEDKPAAKDPRVSKLQWDLTLTIRFILLEMKGVLGYWTFTTKGKATTIPSIIKAFDFVRSRASTIVGFPFTLIVDKKVGYNPGEAKSYPMVTLVPNFSQEAIEMVSSYLEHGGQIEKITTAMIKQKEVLQIGDGTGSGTGDQQ